MTSVLWRPIFFPTADTVVIFPPLDDPYAPKELGKDSFESVTFEKPENAGDNVCPPICFVFVLS
jgi:hypothetical protein